MLLIENMYLLTHNSSVMTGAITKRKLGVLVDGLCLIVFVYLHRCSTMESSNVKDHVLFSQLGCSFASFIYCCGERRQYGSLGVYREFGMGNICLLQSSSSMPHLMVPFPLMGMLPLMPHMNLYGAGLRAKIKLLLSFNMQ